jgi:DNA polymerase-4
MDAFFASVEVARRPELNDKPVCVASPVVRRGVVSAASYPARKFGIHSGMPTFRAKELCPQVILIPPDFHLYEEVSHTIHDILLSITPTVEQTSIDEAYLDLRGLEQHFAKPEDIANKIKMEIAKRCSGITCSIGVGPSRVSSKVAGNFRKPNGYTEIEEPMTFLAQVEPKDIPGIGHATWQKLQSLGLTTVTRIQELSRATLQDFLGKSLGLDIYNMVRGTDSAEIVSSYHKPKSVSHTATLEYNTENYAELMPVLASMCDRLCSELQHEKLYAKTIGVIIRYADFQTTHKQHALSEALQSPRKIFPQVQKLFHELIISGRSVRLVGMELTNLQNKPTSSTLFSYKEDEREQRLIKGIQKIRSLHGKSSIYFGARTSASKISSRFS